MADRPGTTVVERHRPRRARRVRTGLGIAALLAGALAWNAGSADGVDPMWFGARVAPRGGQTADEAILDMEAAIGRPYDVIRIFKVWTDPWPDDHADWLAATGHDVVLSVKSRRGNGQPVKWADIATAQPGSAIYRDIVRWADSVKAYDGHVYLTFMHEPEATTNLDMGVASEFRAAWIHWVEIMRQEGVTNASFMWIMTDHSFHVGPNDGRQAPKWYPGDAFVDGIATDAYNWYTCRGRNEVWETLEEIVEPMRDFGRDHPDQELWLTEFASAEDPARPDRKAQWLRDARALFKQPGWEQFAGVLYFNFPGQQDCNWFVDSSPGALAAYVGMAQDPHYSGAISPPTTTTSTSTSTTTSTSTSTSPTSTISSSTTTTVAPPAPAPAISPAEVDAVATRSHRFEVP